jgi:hypothetical protein
MLAMENPSVGRLNRVEQAVPMPSLPPVEKQCETLGERYPSHPVPGR